MILKKWFLIVTLCVVITNTNIPVTTPKTSCIIGGYPCKSRKPKLSKIMISITSFWGYPVCGATLLSPLFILSAAHCDRKFTLLYASKAADRDANMRSNGLLSWWCPTIKISDIFNHPKFSLNNLLHDISVMKLDSPMNVDSIDFYVKLPIQTNHLNRRADFIAKNEEYDESDISQYCTEATVVGWGTTNKYDYYVVPKCLMCVELPIIRLDVCKFVLRRSPAIVSNGNICAGGFKTKDSCVGDSGGPLICNDYQFGITSWGPDCAVGLPAVYTRVAKYIDFINKTMIKNEGKGIFCSKFLVIISPFNCLILNYLLSIN